MSKIAISLTVNGEPRQGGRFPLRKGGVVNRQFFRNQAHRPAVTGDVVHRQEQDVIVRCEAQQLRSHHRSRGKIEMTSCLFVCELLNKIFALRL